MCRARGDKQSQAGALPAALTLLLSRRDFRGLRRKFAANLGVWPQVEL